ncbi:hypothetical protein PFICI_14462 [Pestalotiopsis fici W106-1]|uniref:Oxidoreductase n=1 Tax=Pestalotiopsis fici (strain W106-1 / CGMCC3.15140) TaxID=1229662 RepID=W3WL26_PESFW|nr:uncharacterized protein PFICI_14462 [Pestalotiopsis fici W106-1]ETS73516.1 hypothetical protein PFICI_14462 [Pestalotiopsis fici W106-1]
MPGAISGLVDFDPEKDIPSLQGKVVFVTGGTAGLGKSSVLAFAKHNPIHVYFTGRNAEAGAAVVEEIKGIDPNVGATFIKVDMMSLADLKAACSQFSHDRLDVLLCNAGIMNQPPGLSSNGYEKHFATNHLGNAMITKQLLPILLKTAEKLESDVRIVNLTSLGWQLHSKRGIDFDDLRNAKPGFLRSYYHYGESKLANIVYARELARRYSTIMAVSVHPGVVKTDLVNNLSVARKAVVYVSQYLMGVSLMEEWQGCLNQLWAAAGAKRGDLVNGAFYRPVGVLSNDMLDDVAKDTELGENLWSWTEEVLANY